MPQTGDTGDRGARGSGPNTPPCRDPTPCVAPRVRGGTCRCRARPRSGRAAGDRPARRPGAPRATRAHGVDRRTGELPSSPAGPTTTPDSLGRTGRVRHPGRSGLTVGAGRSMRRGAPRPDGRAARRCGGHVVAIRTAEHDAGAVVAAMGTGRVAV